MSSWQMSFKMTNSPTCRAQQTCDAVGTMNWRLIYELRLAWHNFETLFRSNLPALSRAKQDFAAEINQLLVQGDFNNANQRFHEATQQHGFQASQPMLFELHAGQGRRAEAYNTYRGTSISKHVAKFLGSKATQDLAQLAEAKPTDHVLVLVCGGPGDEIHFASFYSTLRKAIGAKLTVTCDPRLQALFQSRFETIGFLPVDRLHRLWAKDNRRRLEHARKLPKLSLYRALDDNLFEQLQNYSHVALFWDLLGALENQRVPASDKLPAARERSGRKRKRVGLAWRSTVFSKQRNRHYLTISELQPLLDIKGADFVCLQAGKSEAENAELRSLFGERLLADSQIDLLDDIGGLADLVSELDCVISPATYLAELAGFSGVPTILVSNSTMNLYRRRSDGTDILMPKMWHCEPDRFSEISRHDVVKAARKVNDWLWTSN